MSYSSQYVLRNLAARLLGGMLVALSLNHCVAENVNAEPRPADAILSDVRQILSGSIPPLNQAMPGYVRPYSEAPGLVVGYLTDDSSDGLPWGDAVGAILRRKIMYTPRALLFMPAMNMVNIDSWVPGMDDREKGRSLVALKNVAWRYGIDHILSGHLKIDDDKFTLSLMLRKAPFESGAVEFEYSGENYALPAMLSEVVNRVYHELGIELDDVSREYIAKRTPESLRQLQDYVRFIQTKTDEEGRPYIEKLWNERAFLPALAVPKISRLASITDTTTFNQEVDRVVSRFPGDYGIEYLGAVSLRIGDGGQNDLYFRSKFERFVRLIKDNSADANGMLQLGDLYAKTRRSDAALAVSLEALSRWPNHFRHWWLLAEALNNKAWSYRGSKFWNEVSDQGQTMYPQLTALANDAWEHATRFFPDSPQLLELKLRLNPGYSERMIETFYRIIKLDPQFRDAYATALNYTMPQWGGTYSVHEEIFRRAFQETKDEKWLAELRKQYTPDWDAWIKEYGVEYTAEAQRAFGVPSEQIVSSYYRANIFLVLLAAIGAVALVYWFYGSLKKHKDEGIRGE